MSWLKKMCKHPAHNPPNMIVIKKTYTHKCPGCGQIVVLEPERIFHEHN